jgi:transcriptional regulator with XRE-family HTH domain
VPERGGPSVRRRRLAAELRRLRERAGFLGEEAAERLGWSASKLSRIETTKIGVKQDDLRLLLDLYDVAEPHRRELLALVRESRKAGWIEAATASFPAAYSAYIYAEAEAQKIWNWEPQIIPGLLQTEGYAREVVLGWHSMFRLPPADVELRVEARMMRQQVLSSEQPLELAVVIDESVIHRRFGDRSVMRQQLDHLAESCDLPNVQVQILALNGEHPLGTGSFSYMKFGPVHDVPLHDIVVVEQLDSNYYIEDVDSTNKYRVSFERLREDSLDPAQSRDLIASVAREAWS